MSKMNFKKAATGATLLLAGFSVINTQAGSLDPKLEAAIADMSPGEPVDVMVNDQVVARGEVMVLNDNFCVRISEIVAGVGAASDS